MDDESYADDEALYSAWRRFAPGEIERVRLDVDRLVFLVRFGTESRAKVRAQAQAIADRGFGFLPIVREALA